MFFLIWLIGLLTGGLIVKFFSVIKRMPWYFLVLLVIWYLFGIFAASFAYTSYAEGVPQAGMMALFIFGAIFIILGVLIYIFGIRKAALKAKQEAQPA